MDRSIHLRMNLYLTDSQAATMAVRSVRTQSVTVKECKNALGALPEHNINEKADTSY